MRVPVLKKIGVTFGLLSLMCWHAVSAQTPRLDSVMTWIEVDQLPRSDSVSAPAAAFDARGNFAVVWVAHEKGLSQILLRYFDAVGRPLTEIRPVTGRNDTLSVAHPHLVFTPEGSLWVVWDQTVRREITSVVAQIFNRDLKPVNLPFSIDPLAAGSTSRPRVVCDANGRVITAWVSETRPAFVLARFFRTDGSPDREVFQIDQSGDNLGVGENLDLAVSSRGIAAITWHGLGDGGDRINLRAFDDPGSFIDNKKDVATRGVAHPTLAFLHPDTLILQWHAVVNNTAVLRAQRFNVLGDPVANPLEVTALDVENTPVVVEANEQRLFFSYWSRRDPGQRLFSQLFSQAFTADQKPATKIAQIARTPDFSSRGVEMESAVSPAGNYLAVYAGNDGDLNSQFPRVAAVLTQVALPDLQIANLTVLPPNPKRADSVRVQFSVLNAGLAPAATSMALVEFINTKIDTPLMVPALPAKGTANFNLNMGALDAGNYTLRVTLDHTREVPELEEQNNTAGFPFRVREAPRLAISPDFLNFSTRLGQIDTSRRSLNLRNAGSDTVRWSVVADQPWLLAEPTSGIITQEPTQNTAHVRVGVNAAGLATGEFKASLLFSSNGGNVTIPVTLTIAPPLPALLLQPHRLEFAATQGGGNPPPQAFTIQNRGSDILLWNAVANQPWIGIATGNGSTTLETDSVSARINIAGLPPGSYAGKIFVTSNGGNDSLEISLNVSPQPPVLSASPTALSFVATAGTSNPPAQAVYIRNTGGGTLEWSIDENEIWLSISPRSGQTRASTDSIRVIASISAIIAGNYSATFTINSNGGAQPVRVNFTVNPRPVFPDLPLREELAMLEDCYMPDYRHLAEFVVFNLGDGAAAPSRALLFVNEQLVREASVPALPPGGTFNVLFPAQPLTTGYNTIRCEIDTASVPNEINRSNNSVTSRVWVPRRGDANRDSLVDLRDLPTLVDLVLERIAAPPRQEIWAANTVIDTTLNVADILALIDMLLNEDSFSSSLARKQSLNVRMETLTAQTRLQWQTEQPLLGWQLRWPLSGASVNQPLQSSRCGDFEAHWKVARDTLSLLLWPAGFSPRGEGRRTGEIVLPFALASTDLPTAAGLNSTGELMKLEAQTIAASGAPPQAFSLSPAFPNPWLRTQHRLVACRYELPEAAPVEFRVFTLLGQEVRRAALGWQSAGRGDWQWDGRDQRGRVLAGGVYFIEFAAGNFKKRERLLLR